MRFEQLFSMGGSLNRGALHLKPIDSITSKEAWDLAGGRISPQSPVRLTWHSGSRLVDWVDTSMVPVAVVSDKMIELFEENGFIGWSTYPVEIEGRGGQPIEGYRGIAITGRSGPIDYSRSTEVTKMPISAQGNPYQALIGLYFDASTWDGSDLFMPDGTARTVVNETVKAAVERAKLKNVSFKRLTEVETMPLS